jgi:hypothetical protein
MLCYSNTCANNGLIRLNKFVLRVIKTCVIYFIINIKHSHVTLVILRSRTHARAVWVRVRRCFLLWAKLKAVPVREPDG